MEVLQVEVLHAEAPHAEMLQVEVLPVAVLVFAQHEQLPEQVQDQEQGRAREQGGTQKQDGALAYEWEVAAWDSHGVRENSTMHACQHAISSQDNGNRP